MLVLYRNYPGLYFVSIHQNHRSEKSSVLTSNWRRQGFQPQNWNITFLIFYYFMLVLSVSSPKSKWDKIFLIILRGPLYLQHNRVRRFMSEIYKTINSTLYTHTPPLLLLYDVTGLTPAVYPLCFFRLLPRSKKNLVGISSVTAEQRIRLLEKATQHSIMKLTYARWILCNISSKHKQFVKKKLYRRI